MKEYKETMSFQAEVSIDHQSHGVAVVVGVYVCVSPEEMRRLGWFGPLGVKLIRIPHHARWLLLVPVTASSSKIQSKSSTGRKQQGFGLCFV